MKTKVSMYQGGVFTTVNPSDLPMRMDVEIMLDIGENSMRT